MKPHYKLVLILCVFALLCNCKPKSESVNIPIDERQKVEMITSHGTMTLELYNETPLHRDNFITLISEKAYDSLLFHRVIENFMIQGGDPDSKYAASDKLLGEGDLNYRVNAEFNPDLFHKKGALATAREESPNRASSAMQFFIVQGKIFNDSLLDSAQSRINRMLARHYVINDSAYKTLWDSFSKVIDTDDDAQIQKLNDSINVLAEDYTNFEPYTIPESHRKVYKTIGGTPHLDQNYTVFGQVIDGMEVIDSVAKTKTGAYDRPLSDVRILSVRLKH